MKPLYKNKKGSIINALSLIFSILALLISIGTFLLVYDRGSINFSKKDLSSSNVDNSISKLKNFNFKNLMGNKSSNTVVDTKATPVDNKILDEIRNKVEEAKNYFNKNSTSLIVRSKLNEAQALLLKYKKNINKDFFVTASEKIDIVKRSVEEKSKYAIENFDDLIKYLKGIKIDNSDLNDNEAASTPNAS